MSKAFPGVDTFKDHHRIFPKMQYYQNAISLNISYFYNTYSGIFSIVVIILRRLRSYKTWQSVNMFIKCKDMLVSKQVLKNNFVCGMLNNLLNQ